MHRKFVNGGGRNWEVWEVRPTNPERRGDERRKNGDAGYAGPERRGASDRRRSKNGVRSLLPVALTAGWLTFSSGSEIRRYAPVPANWAAMTSAELSALCKAASVVRRG